MTCGEANARQRSVRMTIYVHDFFLINVTIDRLAPFEVITPA